MLAGATGGIDMDIGAGPGDGPTAMDCMYRQLMIPLTRLRNKDV